MTRNWLLTALVSIALVGTVLAWNGVRQQREFRRLIEVGDAANARDQSSVAIEAFSGAVALQPDSMLGYLKRGDTYRRRGELSAAVRDLQRAATLDSTAPQPKELLGDVYAALGRFDRAIDEYAAFVSIEDRSPRVLYKLALARYRKGESAAAVEPLGHALRLDPRRAEAHHLLGLALRDLRRDAEARASLQRAVTLDPALAPARADLAELYIALGRAREAIQQLEALAALEPARAERLVAVALAYGRMGRYEAAVLTLGRAAEQHPREPLVYAALGRIWLDVAEVRSDRVALRKAIEALQPLVAHDRPPHEVLALYGRALFLAGDAARAERVLTEATRQLPADPLAFLYLAASARHTAHVEVARAALSDYATLAGTTTDESRRRMAAVQEIQTRLGGVQR